ncbi:hypothetical protein J3Q64DRAFT_1851525 [Phycomyces blakesleeanus]|uniref:Uncharacterized protein n=2 Tax=Phycomyces blakesleeanus TaxID=4837 RepID=A0A162TQM4_PHYB8|nr:hypothetical protein PHYBLDRAFT_67118 [Phycomyces blakesleeanus NRRL 1555(-)]OAD69023.1 hypothetical protein PHYBLDRAFT_67118 [Phycomyces blakesleeanus NRRL 1555(-)]|eukprot:XP_018287063.1 hypothetical protein PHYBLDRAFT_67118 [Phycomyces blakesleeanus NRRL 1555(-)]
MDKMLHEIADIRAKAESANARANKLEIEIKSLESYSNFRDQNIITLKDQIAKLDIKYEDLYNVLTSKAEWHNEHKDDVEESVHMINGLESAIQSMNEKYIACKAKLDELTHQSVKL